jgi:UDP-N-acetylmuramoylalanine--D-glutamate ligase
MSFEGMTVVVVGMGKSGTAAVRLLLRRGAIVRGYDESPTATSPTTHPNFTLHRGPLSDDFFAGADAVVVSPGVPLAKPELARARAAGVPVYGEIELGFRTMPRGAGPILAVTGTNGKSTTTALLGELVRQQNLRAFVGGNLGVPLTLAYEDPGEPAYQVHVVELSSFQLEGIVQARFDGAAILNLTPDHLDRYASATDYGAAKARIFENQRPGGFAVVNADDPAVLALAKQAKVPVYGFTRDVTRRAVAGLAGLAVGSGQAFGFNFGGKERFEVTSRALRGAHNLENAMAAALMAHLSGVSSEAIRRGLAEFPGLAHRLESVRVLGGVEWINDSKATNVDSSLVALKALAGRVWLIAGGKGKGAPYAPLVEAARGKVLGVLTIGQDAPLLAEAFRPAFEVLDCGTLETAVVNARTLAKRGDTVLFSPACASYDQFQNFEHRGDTFKSLVRALVTEASVSDDR